MWMQLVMLKEEIARKSVENERLKTLLNQVTSSYQTLQMQILTIRQHQLDQNKSMKIHPTEVAPFILYSPIFTKCQLQSISGSLIPRVVNNLNPPAYDIICRCVKGYMSIRMQPCRMWTYRHERTIFSGLGAQFKYFQGSTISRTGRIKKVVRSGFASYMIRVYCKMHGKKINYAWNYHI